MSNAVATHDERIRAGSAAHALPWHSVNLALNRARAGACSLIEGLAHELGCDERSALSQLAVALTWRVMDTAQMLASEPDWSRLPLAQAIHRRAVLLRTASSIAESNAAEAAASQRHAYLGVVSDPFDPDLQTWLRSLAPAPIDWCLALPGDLAAFFAKREAETRVVDPLLQGSANRPDDDVAGTGADSDRTAIEVLSIASISSQEHPVVRLLRSTLYDALRAGASDVHLESTASGLTIKYRVDGVLDEAGSTASVDFAQQCISRLKVLADLDIAERRVPQDGSFRVRAEQRDIDMRVSVMPSVFGEDAVVRILDKRSILSGAGSLSLDSLGLDNSTTQALRELAGYPYGMLLVTGPTGSGKTTTLYAALSERHTGREKIITIEDPVEYQLQGVLQIPVHEKKGLTFARGLRSILRHDPDIIMVGEIRDRETAEIAVQSALTGHLVFSTVHANSVYDVFSRFTHMGLDAYAFSSALNGVWAQRLIRVNCVRCARPTELSAMHEDLFAIDPEQKALASPAAGQGCGDCRGTGYRSRRAISELLVLDDELRAQIVSRTSVAVLKQSALSRGTRTLRQAAIALALSGVTTFDEVRRVTLGG
jgi:general secretion pathway protein E